MPSTDRKLELKAKTVVAQTGSQPFVYAKGLMKPELWRQILKKNSISTFMKTRPVSAELFQTDRHDEGNSRFSQFCERA
jgi:hypothetical protein